MAARSLSNTNASITSVGYPGRVQNTQAGSTASTIVLDAGASAADSNYVGATVRQTDGAGEARVITAYDGDTRTATVYPDWGSAPGGGGGEEFTLYGHSGVAQAGTNGTITLAAAASAGDDFYRECYIRITAGPGDNQIAKIVGYNGTTKVATFARQLEVAPGLSSVYLIAGEWGTASNIPGTQTTIVLDTTAETSDGYYNGCYLEVLSDDADANAGKTFLITGYVGGTRTATLNGDLAAANTPTYRIFGGWGGAYESVKNYSAYNLAVTASLNQYGIYEASMSDFSYGTDVVGDTYRPSRVQKFGAWGNIAQPAVQGREFFTEPILNDFVRIAIIMFGSNIEATCTPKWISAPQLSTDTSSALVPTSGQTITSVLNSSTTPLGDGATFTGSFEQNDLGDVMVSCQAVGNAGTLFFDFSVDGFNVTTFPVAGFAVTAGIHEFHTAVKGPRFCRVRLVNDAGAAQTELRLYTFYGTFRQGNAPLNQSIGVDSDASTVKAVVAGQFPNGNYNNVGLDTRGNLNVNINSSLSSFDALAVETFTQLDELKFVYGINSGEVETFLSPAAIMTVSQEGTVGLPLVQEIYLPAKSTFNTVTANYLLVTNGGGNTYYFWFDPGAAADPAPAGAMAGFEVDVSADATSTEVTARFSTAVTAAAVGITVVFTLGNLIQLVNAANGDVSPVDLARMPANISPADLASTVQEGGAGAPLKQNLFLVAKSAFATTGAGDYFIATNHLAASYYFWFNTGSVTDPAPGGTGYEVNIAQDTTAAEVATRLQGVVNTNTGTTAISANTPFGNVLQIDNITNGAAAVLDTSAMPLNPEAGAPINSSSSVTSVKGSSLVTLTCGDGLGDFAVLRGRKQLQYRPGQGVVGRMSLIFSAAAAAVDKYGGIASSTNGLYFGYNGANFGIRHQYNGVHAVQSLQILTAGVGTIILTVDGVDVTIDIVQTGNPLDTPSLAEIATQISEADFSAALYAADAINNIVIFRSDRTATGTGTRTFALDGGITGISAYLPSDSFTTPSTASADSTKTNIAASSFNLDKLDGTGPSGITLNPQVGNVYQIQMKWLGFGRIIFSVENFTTGRMFPCHVIYPTADAFTQPSLSQPDMQLSLFTTTTAAGVTTGTTIQAGSMGGFIENAIQPKRTKGASNAHAGLGADITVETVLISVRSPRTYRGLVSQTMARLTNLTVTCAENTNTSRAFATVKICIGGTVSNADSNLLTYGYYDQAKSNSFLYIATPTVAQDFKLANFSEIFSVDVSSGNTLTIDLLKEEIYLYKNENLFITYTLTRSNGNVDVAAALNWMEYY